MSRVVVFDVNQTLLDLRALFPVFDRLFGDASVTREWFGRLLQASMTVSLTGNYMDFGALGRASLEMVAAGHGVTLTDEDADELIAVMRSLPAYPDAGPGLSALEEAGFRMAALTNSPPVIAGAQLASAGLIRFFEKTLSVDSVHRFKPAPEPYRMAASELDVTTADMWMVAAHDWDVAGAMAAGCRGLLVTRPGVFPNPAYPPPDLVAGDIQEAAQQLIGGAH
ncbi:MAG: haloacid dehalogenase type II [Acidimicrobiia bacterium]